ncbi:MAG: hypothetical protein WCF86_03505 [Pseudolabrys sp.]
MGVGVDVEINRKFALRIADTEQTIDKPVPVCTIIRKPGTDAIEHIADAAQRTLDSLCRIADEVGSEFDRSQSGSSERFAERFRLRHLLERGNGIQFVDTQLGEFDTIECKISIRCIDIEDAHHAIAAHKRFDRVVRSDGRLAEIFFYRLRLR